MNNEKFLLAIKKNKKYIPLYLNALDDFYNDTTSLNAIISYLATKNEVSLKTDLVLTNQINIEQTTLPLVFIYGNQIKELPFEPVFIEFADLITKEGLITYFLNIIEDKNLLNQLHQYLKNFLNKNPQFIFSPFFIDFVNDLPRLKIEQINYLRYIDEIELFLIGSKIVSIKTINKNKNASKINIPEKNEPNPNLHLINDSE